MQNPICEAFKNNRRRSKLFFIRSLSNTPDELQVLNCGSNTADSEKKTLHFHCDFSKTRGSFWTYPEYIFNPDESRKNLIGVSFEIKAVQVPAATHFQAANVMAVFNMGNRYKSIIMEKPTSGKWEKREILFPAEWNLEEMKKFRIGMNPVSQQLDFWIRNLKFHYTK